MASSTPPPPSAQSPPTPLRENSAQRLVSLASSSASLRELPAGNVDELKQLLARRELEIDFLKMQLSRYKETLQASAPRQTPTGDNDHDDDGNNNEDDNDNVSEQCNRQQQLSAATSMASAVEHLASELSVYEQMLASAVASASQEQEQAADLVDGLKKAGHNEANAEEEDDDDDDDGGLHFEIPPTTPTSPVEAQSRPRHSTDTPTKQAANSSNVDDHRSFSKDKDKDKDDDDDDDRIRATICDILGSRKQDRSKRPATSGNDPPGLSQLDFDLAALSSADGEMSLGVLQRNQKFQNPAPPQPQQTSKLLRQQQSAGDGVDPFDVSLTLLTGAALSNLSQLAALQEQSESQQHSATHLSHHNNQQQQHHQTLLYHQQRHSLDSPTATSSQHQNQLAHHNNQQYQHHQFPLYDLRTASGSVIGQARQKQEDGGLLNLSTQQEQLFMKHHSHKIDKANPSTHLPLSQQQQLLNIQQQQQQHQQQQMPSTSMDGATSRRCESAMAPLSMGGAGYMSPISSFRRQFIDTKMSLSQPQHQKSPSSLSLCMSPSTSISMSCSPSALNNSLISQHQIHHSARSSNGGGGVVVSATPSSGFGSPMLGIKQSQLRLNTMQIKHKFGHLGQGPNQFNSPHGFCMGLNQEIVVADTNNHRICIFDKNGTFLRQFGVAGKDDGQLWNPRKVVILPQPPTNSPIDWYNEPLFVVCDRGAERSRMQLFTKDGVYVKKIPLGFIDIVAGLAITRNGSIAAVDSVQPTVYIISVETAALGYWFDCSDHMKEPSDIAVKIETLPAPSTSGAGSSSSKALSTSFSSPSSSKSYVKSEFFICDFKGHCVVVYSEEGQCLRKIGHEFLTAYPNGIDISDDGDILVGDSHGNRFHVVVFDRNGNFVSQFECPHVKVSRCCGLKITREGYIVTLAKNNHHVLPQFVKQPSKQ